MFSMLRLARYSRCRFLTASKKRCGWRNDSEHGLAASTWTRDVDRPLRVAREIDAGTIRINDWAMVWDEFDEGGFKRSGNGRLNGRAAMDGFLEYKHIAFNSGVLAVR
jgi:betaine-aldehyde dehydrogenase